MKPGDHPEFYLRPPPEGASRDTRITLTRTGELWHDGEQIVRKSLRDALLSWVDTHPHDGRFILQNGYDWGYLVVEDTPFFVADVIREPDGVSLRLAGGRQTPLDPGSLVVDEEGVLFAEALGHQARFLRTAQLAIAPLLGVGPGAEPVLELAGRVFLIGPRTAARQ